SNPKTNVVMVNDKVTLDRNAPYAKSLFLEPHVFLSLYDNERNMDKMEVKKVTVTMFEKEGKQYVSEGDTLNPDALKEIKKIRNPTPVYIKVDGEKGKVRRSVWSRIVIYAE
ncbi:MAG TPA: hypothetical protein VG603_07225, partial [Chitinophagales bacterium]|nr:hypothetical protein [Chitinophagales bacterium]